MLNSNMSGRFHRICDNPLRAKDDYVFGAGYGDGYHLRMCEEDSERRRTTVIWQFEDNGDQEDTPDLRPALSTKAHLSVKHSTNVKNP